MDGVAPDAGTTTFSLSFVHSALLILVDSDKHHTVKQEQLKSSPDGSETTQHGLPCLKP